jgi:putative hydrolase of HD superfamily
MEIEKYIAFIEEAEKLKSVVRTAWTSSGRRESTAEHSWRLALLAGIMSDGYPGLDVSKVLMMSLIHDIGEIYDGDISAALRPDKENKHDAEYRAAKAVFSILPEPQAKQMMDIWTEYNDNATPEAKLVKALDKAETIIQHNQGSNPSDFDYSFNLEYGKEYFEKDDVLKRLREMIDEKTSGNC